MKLTRNTAIALFRNLGQSALGHLDDATLTTVMSNFNALQKVADDFESLKKELFKRIYGDAEKMAEDEKKRLNDFFKAIAKMEKADRESIKELDAALKATYPDLYEMRQKEVKVLLTLLDKEIEVDIELVDADAFIAGIAKGAKDAKLAEIRLAFAPMFRKAKEEEAKEDFSELDSLLDDKNV